MMYITEKSGAVTEYVSDQNGVIRQVYPERFKYDEKYIAIYDEPERVRKAEALQAIRLAWIKATTAEIHVESLMDIGYGNGAFLNYVADHARHITHLYGSDVSPVPPPSHTHYIGPELWPYHKVDVITFWDVLEHFFDLSFLKELPVKYLVTSMPWCPYNHDSKYDPVNALSNFSNWFHRKPNEHLHHFDHHSLKKTMEMYGYELVDHDNPEDIVRRRYSPNILTATFKKII